VILIALVCFGVDPLEAPIEKDGVSALRGIQRMLDPRIFVYVDNRNKREVAVDITFSGEGTKTTQIHDVLGPSSTKRIYPSNPTEQFGSVLSLTVSDR